MGFGCRSGSGYCWVFANKRHGRDRDENLFSAKPNNDLSQASQNSINSIRLMVVGKSQQRAAARHRRSFVCVVSLGRCCVGLSSGRERATMRCADVVLLLPLSSIRRIFQRQASQLKLRNCLGEIY